MPDSQKVPREQRNQSIRPLTSFPPSSLRHLSLLGKVPFTHCAFDNRFSYVLYIPLTYFQLSHIPLLVLIHSSDRDAVELRDYFIPFADRYGCAIIAPLFPRGLDDPNDDDNYKFIEYNGTRYDQVLLQIVEEVRQRYEMVDMESFFLYGFSGGGQFVHRFCILHPSDVRAAVVAAPGNVTLVDTQADWPLGIRGVEQKFKLTGWPGLQGLQQLNFLFLVGEEDTDVSFLFARGRVDEGTEPQSLKNRRERVADLEESFRSAGATTRLTTIPRAGHQAEAMLPYGERFFEDLIWLWIIDKESKRRLATTVG